jgi:hypothetical protein
MARFGEVAHEPRAGHRARQTEAVDLALAAEGREALEEGLGATGGAHLDADPPRPLACRKLAVGSAGRHLHRLARGQEPLVAVDAEPHRPGDHLEALHLRRVDVTLRKQTPYAPDHVELQQLPAGVLRGTHQLHAHSEWIHVQHPVAHPRLADISRRHVEPPRYPADGVRRSAPAGC